MKDLFRLAQKQINNPKSRGAIFRLLFFIVIPPIIHFVVAGTHLRLVSHNAEYYMSTEQDKTSLIKKYTHAQFFPKSDLAQAPVYIYQLQVTLF